MPLNGQNVVLTGGAGGIGRLAAKELIARGARLTIVDRADEFEFDGRYIRGDLATGSGIADAAVAIEALRPDILINLAGVQYFGPFEQQVPEDVQSHYMVNLVAPVLLTQAVLPGMRRRGKGQIANIGSIFGSIGFGHFVTYSSAKGGLRVFSEALRRELGDTGIGVTYVAPRAVKTGLSNAAIQEFAKLTKMKMDEPEGIACRIVEAIAARRKDVYLGFPESLFVRVNAILPRLVDVVTTEHSRSAGNLFQRPGA